MCLSPRMLKASLLLGCGVCLGAGLLVNACGGSSATLGPEPGVEAGPDSPIIEGPHEAGADNKPDTAVLPSGPLTEFGAFAVSTVYLGETNRSGVPAKDAWKQFGENLDG